jgi:hypothetical protein
MIYNYCSKIYRPHAYGYMAVGMWVYDHVHIDTWPHACGHRAMCTWIQVHCSEMHMESDSNQIWSWLSLWPIALKQICTLVHSAKPRSLHWTIARNRIPRSARAGNKLRSWIYRQIWGQNRNWFRFRIRGLDWFDSITKFRNWIIWDFPLRYSMIEKNKFTGRPQPLKKYTFLA